NSRLRTARVVEEHPVADLHVLEHKVARLIVADAAPGRGAAGRREHVVDRALVGLAFHQPVLHRTIGVRPRFYSEGEVPRRGGGLGSRTLAKQGGRFPATSGSSGPPKAGDDHNSDKLGPQPKEAIGSEKLSPVAHRREQDLFKTSPPALQSPHRSL